MNTPSSRIRGFSLIELLVVMLIIGIVTAFLVPSASTIIKGSQMSQASMILEDQFNLARQYALSSNHPVEVRLIRYADPEVPGETVNGSQASNGCFRAVQILETLDAINPSTNDFVKVPLDKPQLFPQAIVMNASSLSTLIVEAVNGNSPATPAVTPCLQTTPTSSDPSLPRGINLNYYYVAFRFMPDGSTNLPPKSATDANGAWFVTLQNINDKQVGTTPPANFFTLQVDPVGGTLKQFRPGI